MFISWAPYCSRSDAIARRLDGESHMVYAPQWGSRRSTILFKYLSQTLQTLWLLVRRRPSVVFVMAPPVVACAPVWLYCLCTGASFVIDAHTGAFLHRRWLKLQWLQRFFSRRALATVITNRHLQEMVEAWGARATIVSDVPVYFSRPVPMKLGGTCNMVLVSSFDRDEATDEFLEAAAAVPEVQFHVTGDHSTLPQKVLASTPVNVRFTGFLSDEEFVGLLTACDAVIALTTDDHTMQRAAYEAIYLGKPVVTSDFGILRESFPEGAIHVKPTASAIADGIRQMAHQRERLRQEALQLREAKLRRWDCVAAELRKLIGMHVEPSIPDACTPHRAS